MALYGNGKSAGKTGGGWEAGAAGSGGLGVGVNMKNPSIRFFFPATSGVKCGASHRILARA